MATGSVYHADISHEDIRLSYRSCTLAGGVLLGPLWRGSAIQDARRPSHVRQPRCHSVRRLRGDIYLVRKNTKIVPDFERLKLKTEGAIWTTTLDIPPRHWREGFPGVTTRNEWFAINLHWPVLD
jgi:hypothetical protein